MAHSSKKYAFVVGTTFSRSVLASGNRLIGHKKWITGISWEPVHLSSPCRRFVSASEDGDARIWDVTLRKFVICLSGHTLTVTCVKWGGNGVIYIGSQDCTIKVCLLTKPAST
ncbi:hypothetical protein ACFX2A_022497 [Malus domestica]